MLCVYVCMLMIFCLSGVVVTLRWTASNSGDLQYQGDWVHHVPQKFIFPIHGTPRWRFGSDDVSFSILGDFQVPFAVQFSRGVSFSEPSSSLNRHFHWMIFRVYHSTASLGCCFETWCLVFLWQELLLSASRSHAGVWGAQKGGMGRICRTMVRHRPPWN